jgi:thioester reductase-like protein
VDSSSSCGVFLTGATGVLGAHLLKELLETTDTDIYCLVRAESSQDALRRLLTLLAVYDPAEKLKAEFLVRVKPVLGDVAEPMFGLSKEDYAYLGARIDVTIHGAANTNLFARYSKIEPINVGGTRNVIDFVLTTAERKLTYISTYTVLGDKTFDSTFVFRETDLDVGQGFEYMTYQLSKFNAEKLIHESTEKGLNWNIVRPGQIFGDSKTGNYPRGQTNVSGLFYDIFKTVIETQVAIDSVSYYDITPVDYVSKATVFLTLNGKSFFNTLHLVNPNRKTYTHIISLIRDQGYPIRFVTLEEYKRMVFNRELVSIHGGEYKSPTVVAFRLWFRREHFDFRASSIIDCEKARTMLEPRGIFCPKIDANLIGTYIEHGIGHNYFPPQLKFKEIVAR